MPPGWNSLAAVEGRLRFIIKSMYFR
jgi:hypothetical protein